MKKELQQILLGQGLGILKFGMTRPQIIEMIGAPDEKENSSNSDNEEDNTETWHYDNEELSLGFDEEEDWRLVTIAVTSQHYELESLSLMGKVFDTVEDELLKMDIDDLELEDASDDDASNSKNLSSEEFELNLWFEDNVLSEIQWGPLYGDDETIEWPV